MPANFPVVSLARDFGLYARKPRFHLKPKGDLLVSCVPTTRMSFQWPVTDDELVLGGLDIALR
jgi:hypothetical protein